MFRGIFNICCLDVSGTYVTIEQCNKKKVESEAGSEFCHLIELRILSTICVCIQLCACV